VDDAHPGRSGQPRPRRRRLHRGDRLVSGRDLRDAGADRPVGPGHVAVRVRRHHGLARPARRGWVATTLAVIAVRVLLPLAAFLVTAWLQGWQLQDVQSGSMEPTYPVGSLLVIEAIDASEVRTGMALVFVDPSVPGR